MSKKELGQYFTVDEELQKFVFSCTKNKGQLLLEPSFGAGHLLKPFLASNPEYPMVCCEVDKKIVPVVTFVDKQKVIYGDFMKETFTTNFKTIVGNPPYVKVEKSKNLYLQFIEKCLGLLDNDGEMIFIVPSDFLKLTSAAELIRSMVGQGSFTDFLYPNDEKLFIDGVDTDFCIHSFEKGYQTLLVNEFSLRHQLGEEKKVMTPLLKSTFRKFHNPTRLYYIVRNHLYLRSKYPKKHGYLPNSIVLNEIKNCLFYANDFLNYVKAILLAIKHVRKGILGKLN